MRERYVIVGDRHGIQLVPESVFLEVLAARRRRRTLPARILRRIGGITLDLAARIVWWFQGVRAR